jgi:transcriptional regulator with PAS, ATPase and Fis domain
MNFIWLETSSEEKSDLPRFRDDIIPVSYSNCQQGMNTDSGCDAIIAEVRNIEDAGHAFRVLEASNCSVWIYHPAATVESSVAFIKAGASQILTNLDKVERALNSSLESRSVDAAQNKALIGRHSSMQAVSTSVALVANRRCTVLIEGETGTGKEVVAREIHRSGSRSRGPWVAVNCGAIPEALLEAELFGHVKGAFTGAVQGRIGKFEAADHGTIFLDEIGDMPVAVQAKLLRVLQEREVERLGGNEKIRLDVRVIAATNVNLREKVKAGLFRQDLYYRLNVFQITLPPLRDRMDDTPALARHFVTKICAAEHVKPRSLDNSALQLLMQHDWPGNVRELENVIETAVILSGDRSSVFASDIRINTGASQDVISEQPGRVSIPSDGLDYQQALEKFELDLLTQALARTRGNKTAAAELLSLKRTTLSARMRVLETRLPRLVA